MNIPIVRYKALGSSYAALGRLSIFVCGLGSSFSSVEISLTCGYEELLSDDKASAYRDPAELCLLLVYTNGCRAW